MTTKPKREKFSTRSILLSGEVQRHAATAIIANLPACSIYPLEIVIRDPVKARGIDQNGYYWLRLGEIADQAWSNGRQYNSDTWHYYAKRHIMPEEVTTKDGAVCSKWEETPDGELEIISTTRLEKVCFANYTTAVEAFGATLGVQFSANPRGNQ